jgi:hypothetical protein
VNQVNWKRLQFEVCQNDPEQSVVQGVSALIAQHPGRSYALNRSPDSRLSGGNGEARPDRHVDGSLHVLQPKRPSRHQAGTRLIGPASPAELSQKLAALNDLTAPQLRAEWRRLYRGQPPRLSRDLLVRSIAYRIQELAHGGLSKATRRKLLALTKVLQSNGSIEPDDGPNLRPGARLVREWRGRTHTVQVTEDGFEYDGKPYSSLSKIAHAITGAHWSGPRFFGLNRKPTAGPQDSGDASAGREDAND